MSVTKTLRLFSVVIFSVAAATPLFAADSISDATKRDKLTDLVREYLTRASQPNL